MYTYIYIYREREMYTHIRNGNQASPPPPPAYLLAGALELHPVAAVAAVRVEGVPAGAAIILLL